LCVVRIGHLRNQRWLATSDDVVNVMQFKMINDMLHLRAYFRCKTNYRCSVRQS